MHNESVIRLKKNKLNINKHIQTVYLNDSLIELELPQYAFTNLFVDFECVIKMNNSCAHTFIYCIGNGIYFPYLKTTRWIFSIFIYY